MNKIRKGLLAIILPLYLATGSPAISQEKKKEEVKKLPIKYSIEEMFSVKEAFSKYEILQNRLLLRLSYDQKILEHHIGLEYDFIRARNQQQEIKRDLRRIDYKINFKKIWKMKGFLEGNYIDDRATADTRYITGGMDVPIWVLNTSLGFGAKWIKKDGSWIDQSITTIVLSHAKKGKKVSFNEKADLRFPIEDFKNPVIFFDANINVNIYRTQSEKDKEKAQHRVDMQIGINWKYEKLPQIPKDRWNRLGFLMGVKYSFNQ